MSNILFACLQLPVYQAGLLVKSSCYWSIYSSWCFNASSGWIPIPAVGLRNHMPNWMTADSFPLMASHSLYYDSVTPSSTTRVHFHEYLLNDFCICQLIHHVKIEQGWGSWSTINWSECMPKLIVWPVSNYQNLIIAFFIHLRQDKEVWSFKKKRKGEVLLSNIQATLPKENRQWRKCSSRNTIIKNVLKLPTLACYYRKPMWYPSRIILLLKGKKLLLFVQMLPWLFLLGPK